MQVRFGNQVIWQIGVIIKVSKRCIMGYQCLYAIQNQIDYIINLSYIQSTQMRKGKAGAQTRNQPLNINISFNINPKNILAQHQRSQSKFPPTNNAQYPPLLSKNKYSKHKKLIYDNNQCQTSQKVSKKSDPDLNRDHQINKKGLQKIKKKFLNKINDMDITLAPSLIQKKQQILEDDEHESSLMSAKMVQYQSNQFKKSSDSLQLNFHNISGKSKMLGNNQTSKILSIDPIKKLKNEAKLTDRKLPNHYQSKTITHYKGYSTFTDFKGSPGRRRRGQWQSQFKKHKAKQQNLRQKLERFKLDMMKLALAYDESEVLKTKLSSQYYNNIRSREISKQVVDVKMSEVEQHEKVQQIKQFQAVKVDNLLVPGQYQSQSFKNLKQVYNDFNKNKYSSENRESTQILVEYYKQMTTQPKYTIEVQNDQKSQVSEDNYSASSNMSSNSDKIVDLPLSRKEGDLSQFIKFVQNKSRSSKHNVSKQLYQLLEQYNLATANNHSIQHKQIHPKQQQQFPPLPHTKQEVTDREQSKGNLQINLIDESINNEISSITQLKDQLLEKYTMKGDLIFQLQIWQQNYKNELLKMKGKMWKEYKTIKNIIQSRINGNPLDNQIQSGRQRKQNKIMKCLSQKLFSKNRMQIAVVQVQKLKMDQKQLTKKIINKKQHPLEQHLSVEQSLSDENSNEHIDLSNLEGESTQGLNISDVSRKQTSILINGLIEVEMDSQQQIQSPNFGSKLTPTKVTETLADRYKLGEEDKQDIFQFIFLDVCIELYQQAIDSNHKGQNLIAANRILNFIKRYLGQRKKQQAAEKNKKIGISTNMNTVKNIIQEMNKFIMSDTRINDSQLTNKARVIDKLNLPLGPSQKQILRSLRLSLYNNQPVEDYNDEQIQQTDLLVLQPELFLYFENSVVKIQEIAFPKYYDDQKRDDQRINFLRNCTHIHQKAIFDCINENLDYYRIYGIWGKPFIWKKNAVFHHKITEKDLEKALNKSANEVVKCTAYVCGLMVNKEDSLVKDIAGDANYIRRLQDQRIYKLLQNFVLQMQQKWFFHDDEQAEILIELSHIVWTLILKEAIREINALIK